MIIAIFLFSAGFFFNKISFSHLSARIFIRSLQGAIARCSPLLPWRPANTVGLIAPSSSGRATSIVVSIGPRPPLELDHCDKV